MNEIQNSFGRKIKRFRSDKEKGVRYFWGPFMVDIGAQTPFFYIFKERELLYDLFEYVYIYIYIYISDWFCILKKISAHGLFKKNCLI